MHLRRPPLLVSLALAATVAACGGGGGGGGSASPPTGLSYADAAPVYSECVAAVANAPSITGGTPTSFTVFPRLPAGLALHPTTGVLAGTPTASAAPTTYTVTASNSGGSTQAQLVLEVLDTSPAGFSYAGAQLDFAVGVRSDYEATLGSGLATDFELIAGTLPAGLALDPSSGALSGVPEPGALGSVVPVTVRAEHCSGAFVDAALLLSVGEPQAAFAVVLQEGEPVLSTYTADADTGALLAREHALVADTAASDVCASPDGRWVFVAEGDLTAVRTYAAGADGRITATGELVGTGPGITLALAARADSRFLYGVTNEPLLHTWSIDPATGALAEVAATPDLPSEPAALALAPSGRFAFVAGAFDGAIAAFALDPALGAANPVQTLALGGAPSALAVTPDDAFLVCADATRGLVVLSIHPASGALAPVGSPLLLPGGRAPTALWIDPSTGAVHAARSFDAGIDSFELTAGGALVALPGGTVPTLRPVSRFAGTPDGGRLHALVEGHGWLGFDVLWDGSLLASAAPRTVGRSLSRVLAFVPGVAPLSPRPAQLYVAADGAPQALAIAANGTLAVLAPTSGAGPSTTTSIEPHPWLAVAYFTSSDREPGRASVQPDGSLVVDEPGAPGSGSRSIHVDPSGRFAYELRDELPASVRCWSIDPLDGSLALVASVSVPDGPRSLAFHPAGTFVYLACEDAGSVESFLIDWATGELVPWTTTLTRPSPSGLSIDASGTLLAWIEGGNTVAVYELDALDGTPRVLPASVSAAPGATAITFDLSGEHLLVGGVAETARAFAIDRTTGALSNTGLALQGAAPLALAFARDGRSLYAALSTGSVRAATFTAGVGFTDVDTRSISGTLRGIAVRAPVR